MFFAESMPFMGWCGMAKRKNSIQAPDAEQGSDAVHASTTAAEVVLPASLKFLLGCGMALLFTVLTVSLYSPTLHHEKILDDNAYVFDNPLLATSKSFLYPIALTGFFHDCRNRGMQTDLAVNFVLRPVSYGTFYWNRVVHGMDTAGYRVVNIIIHTLNAILLWMLAGRLLRSRGLAGQIGAAGAALIFAVHPVMTESVTYIAQRFESLATLFVLSSVLAWVVRQQAEAAGGSRFGVLALGVVSALCIILAMLSKETGVVTPVLLVLAAWLGLGERPLDAVVSARGQLALLPLLPLMLGAVVFICNGELSARKVLNITNHPSAPLEPLHYAVSEIPVWASYLGVLLWPSKLRFDPLVAPVESMWEPRLWIGLAVCAVLLFLGWLAWRRARAAGGGVVLMGVLWFFIALLPSSSIIPLPDLYAEHRSYLPSIGLFIALAVVLAQVWETVRRPAVRRVLAGGAIVCVSLLAAATWQRNDELRDAVTLYRKVVDENPGHGRAWLILGSELARRGDREAAVEAFERSIDCPNPPVHAFINQGTVLMKIGRTATALKATMRGLDAYPDEPKLQHNAGVAHLLTGNMAESERFLVRALQLAPAHWETALPLAALYYRSQRPMEALSLLEQADRLRPLPEPEAKMLDELRQRSATATRGPDAAAPASL